LNLHSSKKLTKRLISLRGDHMAKGFHPYIVKCLCRPSCIFPL